MGLAVSVGVRAVTVPMLVRGSEDYALLWAPAAVLTLGLWAPPVGRRPAEQVMKAGVLTLFAGPAAAFAGLRASVGAFEAYGAAFGGLLMMLLLAVGTVLVVASGIAIVLRPARPALRPRT